MDNGKGGKSFLLAEHKPVNKKDHNRQVQPTSRQTTRLNELHHNNLPARLSTFPDTPTLKTSLNFMDL
jgi:hypothetical protein